MLVPGSGNISTYFLLLASVLTPTVLGHGNMVKPSIWMDAGGLVGMTPYKSCSAGEEIPWVGKVGKFTSCHWFNNNTVISGEPTLDPSMISIPQLYSNSSLANLVGKYAKKNPWFSPGSAPLYSPCGVDGGNPYGCPDPSGHIPKGQKIGDECREF